MKKGNAILVKSLAIVTLYLPLVCSENKQSSIEAQKKLIAPDLPLQYHKKHFTNDQRIEVHFGLGMHYEARARQLRKTGLDATTMRKFADAHFALAEKLLKARI